jgi:hypothetical protein
MKFHSCYKIRNFRALQLLADSKIEAKSTEVCKSAFLLEVYLHTENVVARHAQDGERPYPILHASDKVVEHFVHICCIPKVVNNSEDT